MDLEDRKHFRSTTGTVGSDISPSGTVGSDISPSDCVGGRRISVGCSDIVSRDLDISGMVLVHFAVLTSSFLL